MSEAVEITPPLPPRKPTSSGSATGTARLAQRRNPKLGLPVNRLTVPSFAIPTNKDNFFAACDCQGQARKAVTRHLGADKTVYGDLIEVAPNRWFRQNHCGLSGSEYEEISADEQRCTQRPPPSGKKISQSLRTAGFACVNTLCQPAAPRRFT